MPYKESFSKVYWESSEIRNWLCNEFVSAFDEEEIRKFAKEKSAWIRKPSPYAKKNGAYADANGNGVWWLRSYGRLEKLSMCVVRPDGGLYPGADISAENVMICSAMYVRR